jgi:hypothetical protein
MRDSFIPKSGPPKNIADKQRPIIELGNVVDMPWLRSSASAV